MTRVLTLAVAFCLLLALTAPLAHAAAASFTVTGSLGRDDISVAYNNRPELVFRPAVAVTAVNAGCTTQNDPVTGRARETRCSPPSSFDLSVDLRTGDDAIVVELGNAPVDNLTVLGGPRNDAIRAASGATTQALRGGDGDDTLSTAGVGTRPVTLDGGTGSDLVDYGSPPQGTSAASVFGGVTASLATGTATWLYFRDPSTGDSTRQDTLIGIERLSGTENGDRLTGGTANDELIGEAGPDDLVGAAGNDTLSGGDGFDELSGGDGTDNIDGGNGDDAFRFSPGGDTLSMRDGFAERISCSNRETVINDLADAVDNPAGCASVSTAAAKHRFDTVLASRRLRVGARRRVRVRVRCPKAKPDRCAGTLRLRSARTRRSVAAGRYRLRPGRSTVFRARLTATEAAAVSSRGAILDAREIDGDGRDRRVTRRVAVN